jgi:hypothetical protein
MRNIAWIVAASAIAGACAVSNAFEPSPPGWSADYLDKLRRAARHD